MAVTQGVGSTSSDIYKQLLGVQQNLDPYLSNAGQAPGFFENKINEMFNYNKPAIQNAAGLEARAYALPGELMGQYDSDYGGNLGVGAMSRMNSILGNIGNQFGLSNAAWNMVDQAKIRQGDLAKKMLDQYNAETGALQQKHNMLLPLWQQMYSEEQANRRNAASIAASKSSAIDVGNLPDPLGDGTKRDVPGLPGEKTFGQKVNNAVGIGTGLMNILGLGKQAKWINDKYSTLKKWFPG